MQVLALPLARTTALRAYSYIAHFHSLHLSLKCIMLLKDLLNLVVEMHHMQPLLKGVLNLPLL